MLQTTNEFWFTVAQTPQVQHLVVQFYRGYTVQSLTSANQEMRFYLELELIAVAQIPQVQHQVAQFVLEEVIESADDRCEPGDEVLFGSSGDRLELMMWWFERIQETCEGQIKP